MKNKKPMSIESKKSWVGFSFVSIWLIGFLVLYVYPFVMSLVYSVYDLSLKKFVGLKYYSFAFTKDQNFLKNLVGSLQTVIYDLPVILILSMIIALLLVQKFRGQSFFKVVFFLPIIMSSGLVLSYLNGDSLSQIMMSGERSGNIFEMNVLNETLANIGLNDDVIATIVSFSSNIFNLILKSGVQILLFIAGLNAISPSIYEAASIDGCTAWERYWKITFPLLSPILLVNAVYTLTDNFITSGNPMMNAIISQARATNYSLSTAMSWIYMVIIFAIIGLVFLIFKRRISYIG